MTNNDDVLRSRRWTTMSARSVAESRRGRIPASVLRFGVGETTPKRFTAHARVECEGTVLVGGHVSGLVELRPIDLLF